MTDTDPFDDCDIIVAHGGARPTDTHLLSLVNCRDDEILDWLERRERRRKQEGTTDVERDDNRTTQEPLDCGP
jgi:hypothetical protein